VPVGVLPQIDRRQMEAEHLDRPHQRTQPVARQRRAEMGRQRGLDDGEIRGTAPARCRARGGHSVAQGLCAGDELQRGGKPGIDADQRAAIGLVGAVFVAVARRIGQRQQVGR
jgi:hypothetical protein